MVQVESYRDRFGGAGRRVVVRLAPRHLAHGLIALVLGAVVISGSSAQQTVAATESLRSWVFEPFNSRNASTDYLLSHPQLGGGLIDGGRDGVINYVIQPGDSISQVANRFGVSTYTVIWANDIANSDLVAPGDVIKIPPVSGVLHTVQAGETLPALSEKFGVDLNTVLNFPLNKVDNPDELIAGQVIIFPGGVKPAPVRVGAATPSLGSGGSGGPPAPPSGAVARPGRFGWPSGGYISQGYWAGHQAIDIAAPYGSPLYAVEGGTVVAAAYGWNGGYGTVVDIDHGNGYVSRYSHLSDMYVTKGQTVGRGAVIGKIGLTGITTGPHVHFEILLNGVRQNPTFYLG